MHPATRSILHASTAAILLVSSVVGGVKSLTPGWLHPKITLAAVERDNRQALESRLRRRRVVDTVTCGSEVTTGYD